MAGARARVVVELHHLSLQALHCHVRVDDEALAAAVLVHEADDARRELATTAVLTNLLNLTHLESGEGDLEVAGLAAHVLKRVEQLLAARAGLDGDVLLGGGHTDHSSLMNVSLKLTTKELPGEPSHLAIPTRNY